MRSRSQRCAGSSLRDAGNTISKRSAGEHQRRGHDAKRGAGCVGLGDAPRQRDEEIGAPHQRQRALEARRTQHHAARPALLGESIVHRAPRRAARRDQHVSRVALGAQRAGERVLVERPVHKAGSLSEARAQPEVHAAALDRVLQRVAGEQRRELDAGRFGGQRAVTKKAAQKWAKAYAALDSSHNEIIDAGRYLDRREPKLAARWVHLRTQPRTSTKPAKPPGGR